MVAEGPLSSISLPALPLESPLASSTFHSHLHLNSSTHPTIFVALGTVITVISLILLALLVLLIRRKKKELDGPKKQITGILPSWKKDIISSPGRHFRKWKKGSSSSFQRFKYSQIQKATDDFSTIIGRGGFGTVYKARFDDGLTAAVKRMNMITRHSQQEFSKEMEFLGHLHHRHLVRLRGFCMKKQERFLVYEYMENGSLKEHLQGTESKTPLTWRTRLQIAIDVASALEYLHCYCEPPLCHRDIKSSNILLDDKFTAKVADFGLAHAAPDSTSDFQQITTDIRGTPGYMDPEYVTTRRLTDKSDIYSYGVLLLELITGRAAVQDKMNLVEWAQRFLTTEANMLNIIDPYMKHTCDADELKSLLTLVKMCTRKEGRRRPSIQQVIRWLQEKLDLNNAENLQHSSAFMLSRDYVIGEESLSYLNISDEIGSLSSSLSLYTPSSECCVSFRFETPPPISPAAG
ncbi:hypothetical protein GOP47_0020830 [Adiantum capillus-veneris]|uniref:non-specific serine/threonine protein kinase n=1 Tax=Adiantum capillus-veneris TaxID=13818 RepID=A0A9D4UA53_ADICA|nr:hypothetical protein GOP47_0020830 [Adiantum capillus-veneris]